MKAVTDKQWSIVSRLWVCMNSWAADCGWSGLWWRWVVFPRVVSWHHVHASLLKLQLTPEQLPSCSRPSLLFNQQRNEPIRFLLLNYTTAQTIRATNQVRSRLVEVLIGPAWPRPSGGRSPRILISGSKQNMERPSGDLLITPETWMIWFGQV